MKRWIFLFMLVVLVGGPGGAWAGPAEELAEIGRERAKAFREGNLDAWVAAYADNAAFQTALVPFRMEGKEAIRAYFATLFERYPTRSFVGRQPLVRVYGTDTTVVTNGYVHVTFVERNGQVTNLFIRNSVTWVKMGGQWRIVDQHNSKLPQ
ncbi:MAG: YybH family protein [Candidatus Rokuibacteriota bacterium]